MNFKQLPKRCIFILFSISFKKSAKTLFIIFVEIIVQKWKAKGNKSVKSKESRSKKFERKKQNNFEKKKLK